MLHFLRHNARWIGGGFLLTFLSSFGQTFFISLSSAEIRAEFALSHGEFGAIYMFATLASAATLPFLGRIVDSMSVKATVMLVVPALAAACLAFGLVVNVTMLVVVVFALRLLGQGMMTHIAITAMGRWFEAQRGRAVSIVSLGHQAGEMSLPLIFAGIVAWGLEWREIWFGCAVVLGLVGLPAAMRLLAVDRTPGTAENGTAGERPGSWTVSAVMRDPWFWIAMTGVLAPAFIGTTIFFHQDYLVERNGWSPLAFASGFALLGVMTITAGLLAGVVVDRVGAVRLLPVFPVPLALSCFALANPGGEVTIILMFGLLGTSYGISQTLFGALWPEVYGTRHLGAIRSTVVAMMVFATAAGPGVTGWLIDAGIPLEVQIGWAGAYCLVMAIVLALASRAFGGRRGVAVRAEAT